MKEEVTIFVCSFCKESFDSNDAITCHILNAHDTDGIVKKLRKQLTSKMTLPLKSSKSIKNYKTTTGQPQAKNYGSEFYCDNCNYKTVHLSTYKRHLLTHEKGGRQHKCMYCAYTAIQPNNLKIHLKTMHPFGAVEPVIVIL